MLLFPLASACVFLVPQEHVRRQHSVDKKFKCSECSYSSVDKASLIKHFRIMHTDERPYSCEICGFRYVSRSSAACWV